MKRIVFFAVVAALAIGSAVLDRATRLDAAAVMAPRFEVDPLWSQPLANH